MINKERMSTRSNQVVARIEGGLGNQLFQYAAARALADRLGCDLSLDLRGLALNGDRPYQLDLYNIRASIATDTLLEVLPNWRPTRWRRFKAAAALRLPTLLSQDVFWPRSFAFDARFDEISRPVYLVGHWQSEKYFSQNRASLLKDIQLLAPLAKQTSWLDRIESSCSVALHIRRGDYVSNQAAAQFHGLCDMSYYSAAIESIKQPWPKIEVFVFSDEPDWARANLRLDVPTHFIDANPGHIDLELMRRCQHHVIANSSFSWWAAWLASSKQQMVCAPRRWFADQRIDTSDVLPSTWLSI
jgi:Glycosyl transferase family 11